MSRAQILATTTLLAALVQPEAAPAAAQEPPAETAATSSREKEETKPPPRRRRRPRLDSSNTGYIDNAVVASQVRVRFDSAFNADRPDRAEFLYGKCICWDQVDGQRTADAPGVALDLDYHELSTLVEVALGERWSLFTQVPVRSMGLYFLDFVADPVNGAPAVTDFSPALGDIQVGFKRALRIRDNDYLTFKLAAYLPTGDAREGMGTGHASVEPALLYLNRLGGGPWTLETELRLWVPLSGSADPVTGLELDGIPDDEVPFRSFKTGIGTEDPIDNDDFAGEIVRFGVGLSRHGRTVDPVVEIVGWRILGGYATVPDFPFFEDVSGTTIANLKVGLRLSTASTGSLYLGYGLALTDDIWYDDIIRLEFRRGF